MRPFWGEVVQYIAVEKLWLSCWASTSHFTFFFVANGKMERDGMGWDRALYESGVVVDGGVRLAGSSPSKSMNIGRLKVIYQAQ